MFHANDILLHSSLLDEKSIQIKFSQLIQSIIDILKMEHLDRLIHSSTKHVPPEARVSLVDGIIRGRCDYLKTLLNLSINEQYHILAKTDMALITPHKVEELNPTFANLVYSIVRGYMLM